MKVFFGKFLDKRMVFRHATLGWSVILFNFQHSDTGVDTKDTAEMVDQVANQIQPSATHLIL